MRTFSKPKIVVSKCLEFSPCRYDGSKISASIVDKLKAHVEFIPVCPEVEIGLGIPRESMRIIDVNGKEELIQPKGGRNLTKKMDSYSKEYLNRLMDIDGFLLKSRSPSCGIKDVKVYSEIEKSPVLRKTNGHFSRKVLEKFPFAATEDEGRLENFTIRAHFLTKLYTLADFRKVKQEGTIKALIQFQSINKYLFMAYSQSSLKELGRLTANHAQKPIGDIFVEYEQGLSELLRVPTSANSNINVLEHIFGYMSKQLSKTERDHFLELVEEYRIEKVPLHTPVSLLKSWALRFEQHYLLTQTYFEPYPLDLVSISDSGKGRNYA